MEYQAVKLILLQKTAGNIAEKRGLPEIRHVLYNTVTCKIVLYNTQKSTADVTPRSDVRCGSQIDTAHGKQHKSVKYINKHTVS